LLDVCDLGQEGGGGRLAYTGDGVQQPTLFFQFGVAPDVCTEQLFVSLNLLTEVSQQLLDRGFDSSNGDPCRETVLLGYSHLDESFEAADKCLQLPHFGS
jgi:hypothetical protein